MISPKVVNMKKRKNVLMKLLKKEQTMDKEDGENEADEDHMPFISLQNVFKLESMLQNMEIKRP